MDQVVEPSPAASQGAYWQEARLELEPELWNGILASRAAYTHPDFPSISEADSQPEISHQLVHAPDA